MKLFHLHYLDRTNIVVLNRAYSARDELDALAEAQRRFSKHTIEVWEGDRKVARVKRGNLAPTTNDRWGG
jgi:hypothetical protein